MPRRPLPTGRTDRLLAVVALLLRRRVRPVTLADVERAAGCSRRTAYRLVEALVRARLVVSAGERGGGWRLRGKR